MHLHRVQTSGKDSRNSENVSAYVGWTGMLAASSMARFSGSDSSGAGDIETVEIDPQFAAGLGLAQGDVVCLIMRAHCFSLADSV